MNRVLVTGSSGFIGKALCQQLVKSQFNVRGTVRLLKKSSAPLEVEQTVIQSITQDTDWKEALEGVSVVVHLAARVHIMDDNESDPLVEYRKVNTAGTLNLAKQAAQSGVKRFIFLSSIKVNGENTSNGKLFSPDAKSIPTDPYGLSKYEAEKGLLDIARETGMEVVIIRPPLVYGPGVKANFESMMRWVNKGIFLPLGSVRNKRSLVALDNLVSFIILCIHHPKAANQIFLISDSEDVSTTELLEKMAKAFNRVPRLIPVPEKILRFAAKLIGKAYMANRLLDSLQVDSSKARDLLGWKSVVTMDEELQKAATSFLNEKK